MFLLRVVSCGFVVQRLCRLSPCAKMMICPPPPISSKKAALKTTYRPRTWKEQHQRFAPRDNRPRMLNTLTRRFSQCALLSCALISIGAISAHAQANTEQKDAPSNDVHVIPRPRQLTKSADVFHLGRNPHIVLADTRAEDDRFAAQDFIDDVNATADLKLNIGGRNGRRTILIGLLNSAPVQSALRRANAGVPPKLNDEGYVLSANADSVVVAGQMTAGTLCGLQTLKPPVRG